MDAKPAPDLTGAESAAVGIWRYAHALTPLIDVGCRVTLGEGGTPLQAAPRLAAQLGLTDLLLKREDLNPTGSHKDRGMAFQVSAAVAAAASAGRLLQRVALSSSGNAAISAAAYGRAAGLGVVAFMAPATDADKLARLRAGGAAVIVSPNALTLCEAWCAARGVPNLRPSTDPAAVEGFLTLGWEILSDLSDRRASSASTPEAIFTFVSSAASLVGIGRAFARSAVATDRTVSPVPALHAVQGMGGLVAAPFDTRRSSPSIELRLGGQPPDVQPPDAHPPAVPPSRVGALGARKTRRLGEAQRLIRATHGGGWWIADAEADAADALLGAHGIHAALEAAASVAAARRAAAEAGIRRAIVVVTGARRGGDPGPGGSYQQPSTGHGHAPDAARTIEDVDRIVQRTLGDASMADDTR